MGRALTSHRSRDGSLLSRKRERDSARSPGHGPQHLFKSAQNTIEIVQHVTVPEADDLPSRGFQKPITDSVFLHTFGSRMCIAIQLYDEHGFDTRKVREIRPNRVLSSEFPTGQLAITQLCPDQTFWKSQVPP